MTPERLHDGGRVPTLCEQHDRPAIYCRQNPSAACAASGRDRCPSVYPPSADAPHEGTGWSGPVRCVLSPHDHKRHLNSGIYWSQP